MVRDLPSNVRDTEMFVIVANWQLEVTLPNYFPRAVDFAIRFQF